MSPASARGRSSLTGTVPSGITLTAVSCPAPRSCTAVGGYGHGPGLFVGANYKPVYATETAGVWGRVVELPTLLHGTVLTGISCSSPQDCTAVGTDYSGEFSNHGDEYPGSPIYATETAGTWGPLTVLGSAVQAGLTSVSCVAALDCTAVGTYEIDGPTTIGPIVATETAGTWGPITVLPTLGDLLGVSCTSATDCTAVGDDLQCECSYGVLTTNLPIVATESAGTWGAPVEVTTPSKGVGSFSSVSCTGAGDCTAVGTTVDGSGGPFYSVESRGTWGPTIPLAVPSPTAGDLQGVDCSSSAVCTAVGGSLESIHVAETAGVWGEAGTEGRGDLFGVSCQAAAECTAVGSDDLCTHPRCTGPSVYAIYASERAGRWPTAPGPPRSVKASPGGRSIEVTWSAPSSDGGSPIIGYTASAVLGTHQYLCASARTSCTIPGLSSGRAYSVRVFARSAAGASTGSSASVARPRS